MKPPVNAKVISPTIENSSPTKSVLLRQITELPIATQGVPVASKRFPIIELRGKSLHSIRRVPVQWLICQRCSGEPIPGAYLPFPLFPCGYRSGLRSSFPAFTSISGWVEDLHLLAVEHARHTIRKACRLARPSSPLTFTSFTSTRALLLTGQ